GRTDWSHPDEVADLDRVWQPLLALLRTHSAHEDDHIFRLLDERDPLAVEPATEQHRDLEDLLEEIAERFGSVLAAPDPQAGLALYRDLNRFVAAYLPHLHDEETRIMGRIWACCTDGEIAAARAAFMADTTPEVQATTLRYLLPAIDAATRRKLAAGLAGAPPAVIDAVRAIAEEVLDEGDAADLHSLAP
ncbi:MAG TPA: hemerythrin domain-containing protein, partial [Solirubrobacteraceae bacterium]